MKHEDVKVGMKVKPFQKTVWNWDKKSIEEYYSGDFHCVEIGDFLKKNGYLYVTGYDEEECVWALDYKPSEKEMEGDYFNAEDFEPYVESTGVEFQLSAFSQPHGQPQAGKSYYEALEGVADKLSIEGKELKALREFKQYWDNLYGDGLQISNWHQNGNLEPFDNFYESALAMYDEIMEDE